MSGTRRKKRKTEVSEEDVNARSWRGDPAETFSDWKIEITTKYGASAATTKYHVHKIFLGLGTRKSNYFVNLFRNAANNNFQESNASTSQIELEHPVLAESFPYFLDYIYGVDPDWRSLVSSNTKIIVGLHSLAEYFEAPQLRSDAERRIYPWMSIKNVYPFYEWATILLNNAIKEEAAKFIAKNIKDLTEDSPLVTGADIRTEFLIPLWVDVVQHFDPTNADSRMYRRQFGIMIAKVCETQRDVMDWESFQKLTDESVLPDIAYLPGISLVETEDSLLQLKSTSSSAGRPLTSLQRRCIKAIPYTTVSKEGKLATFLESRSKAFLLELSLVQKGKT